MAHMLKPLFAVAAGIATLISGGPPSHAQPQASARQPTLEVNVLLTPTAAFALDENADPAAVRIEEIRAQLATQNHELLAMQKDGETAQGEDAQALWSRSIELHLDSAVTFREWVENVATLAANGAAVGKYEAQLKSLLPGATLSTQSLFETLQKSIADISTQLESEGEGHAEVLLPELHAANGDAGHHEVGTGQGRAPVGGRLHLHLRAIVLADHLGQSRRFLQRLGIDIDEYKRDVMVAQRDRRHDVGHRPAAKAGAACAD